MEIFSSKLTLRSDLRLSTSGGKARRKDIGCPHYKDPVISKRPESLPVIRQVSFRGLPFVTTPLIVDFFYNFERVQEFYACPPFCGDWVRQRSPGRQITAQPRAEIARILEKQNRRWGAGEYTLRHIEQLRQGAAVVVAGHQPAVFGGSLACMLKVLSLARFVARAAEVGVRCVPIFWLATEDHDHSEVDHAVLADRQGNLCRLKVSPQGVRGVPIADLRLGPDIEDVLQQVTHTLGDNGITQALRECYKPGESYSDAFARLYIRLFAAWGIVLLDASDPELHRLAAPIYCRAIERTRELTASLLERGRVLQELGYHEQVRVATNSTLLFALDAGSRVPIRSENGRFEVNGRKMDSAGLIDRLLATPGDFSPNVLFRAIVQDYLLPTIAYFGGLAEIAYFAQASVVYKLLLSTITPVLPRFSVTLLEPHVQRLLNRYKISPCDLFRPRHALQQVLGKRRLRQSVQSSFATANFDMERVADNLSNSLAMLDGSLMQAVPYARGSLRGDLERVHTRAAECQWYQDRELRLNADLLARTTFIRKQLQESRLSGISFVARYGPQLFTQLFDQLSCDSPDHSIVFLNVQSPT